MDQNYFKNLYLTLQSTMAELRMIDHFKTILFNSYFHCMNMRQNRYKR